MTQWRIWDTSAGMVAVEGGDEVEIREVFDKAPDSIKAFLLVLGPDDPDPEPFLMWLKFTDHEGTRWAAICPTGGEPYEYDTEDAARRMLQICYPDICRDERLGGPKRTAVLRKGETPEEGS